MYQLYDENKSRIYYMAYVLLEDMEKAHEVTKWSLLYSMQYLSQGNLQTEKEFYNYAVKQAVLICKKMYVKQIQKHLRYRKQKIIAWYQ